MISGEIKAGEAKHVIVNNRVGRSEDIAVCSAWLIDKVEVTAVAEISMSTLQGSREIDMIRAL